MHTHTYCVVFNLFHIIIFFVKIEKLSTFSVFKVLKLLRFYFSLFNINWNSLTFFHMIIKTVFSFFFFFLCLCMRGVYLCIYICLCVDSCMCMCRWRPEVVVVNFLWLLFYLGLWFRILNKTQSLLILLV